MWLAKGESVARGERAREPCVEGAGDPTRNGLVNRIGARIPTLSWGPGPLAFCEFSLPYGVNITSSPADVLICPAIPSRKMN